MERLEGILNAGKFINGGLNAVEVALKNDQRNEACYSHPRFAIHNGVLVPPLTYDSEV